MLQQFRAVPDMQEFEMSSLIVGSKTQGTRARALDTLVIADSFPMGTEKSQVTSKGG